MQQNQPTIFPFSSLQIDNLVISNTFFITTVLHSGVLTMLQYILHSLETQVIHFLRALFVAIGIFIVLCCFQRFSPPKCSQEVKTEKNPSPDVPSSNQRAELETFWNNLCFTDEQDQADFGNLWGTVRKIKYNDPSFSLFQVNFSAIEVPIVAWRRVGWYISRNQFVSSFDFRCISEEVIANMFTSLGWSENTHFIGVKFACCSLSEGSIKCMLPFLKSCREMTEFCLNEADICSKGFELLRTEVFNNSQIKVLSLIHCRRFPFQSFDNFNLPNLRRLDLSWNKIGDEVTRFIAENFLKESSKLQHLYLRGTEIGDEGVGFISAALVNNQSLETLDLSWNDNITNKGARYLSMAIFHAFYDFGGKLYIARSNHSLQTVFLLKTSITESVEKSDLEFALDVNRKYVGNPEDALWVKFVSGMRDVLNRRYWRGEGLKCPICWELKNEFYVFVPCGHKVCSDCKTKLRDMKCYNRCGQIVEFQRVY